MIEMLQEPVIRRVTLSRYLFELATQNARSDQEVAGSACVNLLQDAIEIFLLAASNHLNVDLNAKTRFPQYLDKINEAINDELPGCPLLSDANMALPRGLEPLFSP